LAILVSREFHKSVTKGLMRNEFWLGIKVISRGCTIVTAEDQLWVSKATKAADVEADEEIIERR